MNGSQEKELYWEKYAWALAKTIPFAYYGVYGLTMFGAMLVGMASSSIYPIGQQLGFALLYFGVGLFIVTLALPFVLLIGIPVWLTCYKIINGSWSKSLTSARLATAILVVVVGTGVCVFLAFTVAEGLKHLGVFAVFLSVISLVGLLFAYLLSPRILSNV